MKIMLPRSVLCLAVLLAPLAATSADPVAIAGIAVAVIELAIGTLAATAGTVSMVTDVAQLVGDYEEARPKIVVKSFTETITGTYRGHSWKFTREYWVDWNGQSRYVSTRRTTDPSGRVTTAPPDSIPFRVPIMARSFSCSRMPGQNDNLSVQTLLGIGYDVPKPANNAMFCFPNPLVLEVQWNGIALGKECDGGSWPFAQTQTANAPRRDTNPLAIPYANLEVIDITLRRK